MAKKWSKSDIPDLTGKIAIITGANSGLGFQNCIQFAKNGATVIMACRSPDRGKKALKKVMKSALGVNVELMILDLGNLEAVKDFVDQFSSKYDRLDILLNNAGVVMVTEGKTVDGFERHFGTNHLGHFALTAQLYPILKKTPNARIINVSGSAHEVATMDFSNLQFETKGSYSRTGAYYRSKLANMLFTYEMDRRFKEKDVKIISVAAHPGMSQTSGIDHIIGSLRFLLFPLMRLFIMQSAAAGALVITRAAVDPTTVGGEYYGPRGWFGGQSRGSPSIVQSSTRSHNLRDAKKLWEISEDLTGVKFEIS